MTVFELTKGIVSLAAGIGAKSIATNAITNVAPPAVNGTQKLIQTLGATGIGLTVASAASKSMGAYCDKLKALATSIGDALSGTPEDEEGAEDETETTTEEGEEHEYTRY